MVKIVKSRRVYEGSFNVIEGYSLDDTGRVYSFGWMYSLSNKFYLELCYGSIARLTQRDSSIEYEVYSTGSKCWEEAIDRIPWVMGFQEDYSWFYSIARGDVLLGGVVEAMPGYRLRATSTWQAAIVAIAQQNASFRQGWGMVYRLYLNTSRRIKLPGGGVFLETPSPEAVGVEAARASGYGYRAETISRVAELARKYSGEDLVDRLLEVRGIGSYSYSLARLFALKDYSVKPIDRWSRKLLAIAYHVDPRLVEEELDKRYPSWAGLALLLLTIAFDAEVTRRAIERLKKRENKPGLVEPSPVSLWKYTPPR